jgi:hypothetical protein
MAIILHGGPRTLSGKLGTDGHREYRVLFLLQATAGEGPAAILATDVIPGPGIFWDIDGDVDAWAWFTGERDAKAHDEKEGDPIRWWAVECVASTLPPSKSPEPVGNPLLEPPKITITFASTNEEATRDRFGRPLTFSSWEQIRGKQVEFPEGTVSVKITQNVATFDLAAHALSNQAVNMFPMWGMPRRTIKLGGVTRSEAKYYGAGLSYYERSLDFEARYGGWDRDILDEGTLVLRGDWKAVGGSGSGSGSGSGTGEWEWVLKPSPSGKMPDPNNPRDFIRATDTNSNPRKIILNGHGTPAGVVTGVGSKFLSVQAGNTGQAITDSAWWVGSTEPVQSWGPWDNGIYYPRGAIAEYSGTLYAALKANHNLIPSAGAGGDIAWRALPSGAPVNRGLYNPATTYALGDYAEDITQESAGIIHIEKAAEVDFITGLGVPASI